MHQIQNHTRPPEGDRAKRPKSLSLTHGSSYESLRQLVSDPRPATDNLSSADNEFATRCLTDLTASVQGIITERKAAAKETFRQAVAQFEAEVLPRLTSDLKRSHDSAAAVQLEQVLEKAIREDLVRPFMRGSGAVAFSLLEYVDRYKSLERTYPGVHALVADLKACGLSIDAEVESTFEAAVSSRERIERLQERLGPIDLGKALLASALLSLPAIAGLFSPAAIHEALQLFQPRYTKTVGLSPARTPIFGLIMVTNQDGLGTGSFSEPQSSPDFASNVVTSLQRQLSAQDFDTAREIIQSPEFIFAARLNAGRFERIRMHVEAFCAAVRNPYGESPESIGKECIHSLCQEFKSYRDDFILWRFPFSRGAAQAIRGFETDSASGGAAASVGDKGISWSSHIFRSGFTPPDPGGERVDLCIKEPRFLVLGAMLRRGSGDLLSILRDLTKSEMGSKCLSRGEFEPLRLFLLGHATAPLTAHQSAIGSRSLLHWVSLNTSDIQRFGGLLASASFRDILLATSANKDYMPVSRADLVESAFVENDPYSPKSIDIVMCYIDKLFVQTDCFFRVDWDVAAARNGLKQFIEEAFDRSVNIDQNGASDARPKAPQHWNDLVSLEDAMIDVPEIELKDLFPERPWASLGLCEQDASLHRLLPVVSSLGKIGYRDGDISKFVGECTPCTASRIIDLLRRVAEWKVMQESPLLRPPLYYLLKMTEHCHPKMIGMLASFLSQSPDSIWRDRIDVKDFIELFHAVFSGVGQISSSTELAKMQERLDDDRSRLLTILVSFQRASSTPILSNASIKQSLAPDKIVAATEPRRAALKLAMYTDRINYKKIDPLDGYILCEEINLLRFQQACDIASVFRSSDTYLAAKLPQPNYRTYSPKLATLSSITRRQAPPLGATSVQPILRKHALLFSAACEVLDWAFTCRSSGNNSPMDAAAIVSLPGLFFFACSKSSFERREFEALFNRIDRLDPNTLARYVERLVDALDGGFHDNIELTYRNKPLAKALAKELKLDVLMAELRSHYDAGLECQPGPKNIEVTFMPTIGWLMEVSGAISGSCVGNLTKIAETYTEGVFVPFVVQGDPPQFSGGSFVFEGVLANGERVMVIRGFNPRTFLLSNVRAGDLFEAFADYVAEMGRACGATRVVLPQADFWHNPATLRPNVHFYFQDNYMKKARMKLGDCQVRTFNNFNVEYVVSVREIRS